MSCDQTGLLVVSAPDLEVVVRTWLTMTDPERWGHGIKMIYGSQEHAGMFHKNGFTPERLADILRRFHLHEEWHFRGYPATSNALVHPDRPQEARDKHLILAAPEHGTRERPQHESSCARGIRSAP